MRNQLIDGSPQHELHLQRCNRKSEPPVIKCTSLVMGKKLGADSKERPPPSSWNFYLNECIAPRRDIGGRGSRSRNLPVSRRHRSNFCGISAEESRQPQNIKPRDARCFYKNHGDQSRSFALTRRIFFPVGFFSLRIPYVSFWSF